MKLCKWNYILDNSEPWLHKGIFLVLWLHILVFLEVNEQVIPQPFVKEGSHRFSSYNNDTIEEPETGICRQTFTCTIPLLSSYGKTIYNLDQLRIKREDS